MPVTGEQCCALVVFMPCASNRCSQQKRWIETRSPEPSARRISTASQRTSCPLLQI